MRRIEIPPEIAALHGGRSKILLDIRPVKKDSPLNRNQIQATKILLRVIEEVDRNHEPLIASVTACMAGGKSGVALGLKRTLGESCQLFKQVIQVGFDGELIKTHGGLYSQEIAVPFNRLIEVVTGARVPVVVAEEVQFAPLTKEEMREVRKLMKEKGMRALVCTGLDFDFRKVPWESTQAVLQEADLSLVLAARCVKDGRPAFFTQRTIIEPDGTEKPAFFNDPVVLAGNVGEDGQALRERYDPMCDRCHRVLPPRENR